MANEFKVKRGLVVNGSGSVILDIQGSQGQLFSVTDSLTGSLFSVNDISGMPILAVSSDDSVRLGTFNREAIRVSGSSATITGSFTGSFTGSLLGTASWANNATSASITANAVTASYVLNAVSSSFAATASSADNFNVRGTLTATTIVVQTITSSTDFVTGSTRFGSSLANTHQFTGSVSITGSLTSPNITGSLQGTASWADNATTASYVLNAVSASFATSAANANTASFVLNAASASYALTASFAATASFVPTSSLIGNFFAQGGNSFGAQAILGTNDSQSLAIRTNGSTRITVNSTGSVGINTTSPGAFALDVNGTARVSGNTKIGNTVFSDTSSNLIVGIDNGSNASRIAVANGSNYQDIMFVRTGAAANSLNNWSFGQRNDTYFGNATGSFQIAGGYISDNGTLGTPAGGYRVPLICNPNGDVIIAGASANAFNGDVAIGTTTLGTATKFTLGGSETASSAIARGQLINTALSASANNDVLVGLDVNPTMIGGAFTGVTAWSLRVLGSGNSHFANKVAIGTTTTNTGASLTVSGNIEIGPTNRLNFLLNNATHYIGYSSANSGDGVIVNGFSTVDLANNGTTGLRLINGNTLLGTTANAGFRLDVNGTARVSGNTQITGSLTVVTGSSIEFQVTNTGVTIGNSIADTHTVTGSLSISGSVTATNFTGSLLGTAATASYVLQAVSASFATQAANATTASYVLNAVSASFATSAATATTASYILNAASASYALSSSYALNASTATSASFATNAATAASSSFATNAATATSASYATFAATASSADAFNVRGTLTATTLVVQTITSSTDFVTGSTRFGSLLSNTHTFTGSILATGSLTVDGVATLTNLTGSLFGTASWANNATSASTAISAVTASYVLNAVSASFATNAANATTASFVLNAVSASFATNASTAASASFATNAANATSASYALSSSYALNASTATSASFATNASTAASASFATNAANATSASFTTNAISASYAQFANTASSADNFNVRGTLTATTLIVQTITSSQSFITGSTRFGSLLTDTHQFTGSILATGSVNISGVGSNSATLLRVGGVTGAVPQAALAVHSEADVKAVFSKTGSTDVALRLGTNGAWGDVIGNYGLTLRSTGTAGSTSDGRIQIIPFGGTTTFFFSGSGNAGFNQSTDAGFKVDINGTARVQGTTTISGDNNLIFQRATDGNSLLGIELRNSGGTERGALKLNLSTGEFRIGATNGGGYFPTFYSNGSEVIRINSGGNVGIGTTAPSAKLDVNGNTIISGSFTVITGSAIEFQVTNTGVRIGNAATDIHTATGSLSISGSTTAAALRGSGSAVFSIDGTSGRLFQVDDSLTGSLFSVNTAGGLPIIEAFSDNTVRIGQFGRRALFVSQSAVGIGKETLLNGILDVSGSVVMSGSLTVVTGSGIEFQVTNTGVRIGNIITDVHTVTGSINVSGSVTATSFTGSLLGTATTASYVLQAVSASFATSAATATTASFVLQAVSASFATQAANASSASYAQFANTASSADNFNVRGTLTATTLVVQTITSSVIFSSGSNRFGNDLANTQTFTGSLLVTGSNHAIFGNVGIGTTAPVTRLEVSNAADDRHFLAVGSAPSLNLGNTNTGPLYYGTLGLATATNNFIQGAVAGDLAIVNRGSVSGSILFGIGALGNERMRITPAGNVGIGTATPTLATLQVNGNVFATSFTGSFSGSFAGSIINATSASYAATASVLLGSVVSASYALTSSYAFNASTAASASFATNAASAISSSYALFAATASSADNFTVRGTLTAQTIVAQTITSSTVFSSGSNRFGNDLANTQVFTGSVNMTGSLGLIGNQTNTGSINLLNGTITVSTDSNANRSTQLRNNGLFLSRTSDGGYASTITADGTMTYNTRNSHIFQNDGSTTMTLTDNTRNVLIGTTSDAGFRLDVNGTARVVGNSQFNGRVNFGPTTDTYIAINTSSSGNLGRPNIWSSLTNSVIGFLAGTGGAAKDSFLFGGCFTTDGKSQIRGWFNDNSSIVNINQGYADKGGGTGNNASILLIDSILNFASANTYNITGILYNPTLTSLNGATHRAIQTVTGDVLLGTTSGNVAIGTSTLATATELTLGGSQTASSAIARGQLLNTALTASANNDVLVGLDIAPTFTNGAFTGVTNYGLRSQARVFINPTIATTNSLLRITDNTNGTAWMGFSSATATGFFIGANGSVTIGQGVSGDNAAPIGSQITIRATAGGRMVLNTNSANEGIQFTDSNNATIRMNFPSANEAAITTISTHNLSIGTSAGTTSAVTNTMKFFASSNNVGINQNTDAGFRLDVSGSTRFNGNSIITGSLTVITGSAVELQVTNAGVTIGNSIIDTHTVTGSLSISGSVTATNFTGSLLGTATTASYVLQAVSASFATSAASSSFASTASFSRDFTVGNTLVIDATLTDYASIAASSVGSNNLFSQNTGSYTSAFFKYTCASASFAARSGEVVAVWNGTSAQFYDNSTVDIGNTTPVTASVAIVSGQVQFNMQTNTSGWAIKSMATFI